ncbi:MAG: hypothetical protein PHV06_10580, partial [bacterium]|nr:hypothetical protein [bacterium]
MKKQVCKTKFINRENEIQILWKEYLLTQNTNKRRTVFISGDYYIGKTALALNFKNILIKENTKLDFINLSFKDSAGITFQDIITRIFVQLDGGDTGKAQKRLQEELSGIISLDELKKMNVIIEKTDKNNKTFRESINLIVELFKRRDCSSSIIILFDDLETCGKIIKEWILEVSEKLKDFPVLIIYSDRDQNDINLFKPKQCLFLDNLPISSAKKMIEQYFPTAKTDPVITSFILQLTRGNPGLIEQYAAFIIEEKIIKVFKDRIRIKTGRVNKVPEKIKEELKSDYSALKPEEKDVLISASIFGESFSSKILSAVFGFDMSLLKKILAGLEEKRFIQKKMSRNREGYFSEIDYKFSYHYKVCLAYDLVPKQKKGKMHAEIAEYLMGKFKHGTEKFYDEILYHFINSGAKEKLNNFLSFYSDYKYREGKLKESAEILSDLVKNLGVTAYKSRSGAENHIKLANILCRTGEQDRGLEILEKLEEKSREIIDTELLPDFLVAKGLLLEEKGLYEQAFGLLKNAYNLIETFSGINPFLLADCINGLGIINNWKGDYNDSIQKFKEVIKLRKELFKKPHP